MSEFQHYQFRTVEQQLTRDQRSVVSSWSSRSTVTATHATFTYHYSDFKKDPLWVVEHYFDLMIYFSNWGSRRLIIRLPADAVDHEQLNGYIFDNEYDSNYIYVLTRNEYVLIDIYKESEEDARWMDEQDYAIDDLVSVRAEILAGNYRSLYLLWTHFALLLPEEEDMENDNRAVPEVPGTSSIAGLSDLMTFFEVTF